MTIWQQLIISVYGISSLIFFCIGLYEITKKKNPFGITTHLFILGVFVWGDIFVLGPFWILVCLLSLLAQSWSLFLLSLSLFWVVRSFGEIHYWIGEQFTGKNRNHPSTLYFHSFFKNEAVWFIYQLIWQCVLVFATIASIYFAKVWLSEV